MQPPLNPDLQCGQHHLWYIWHMVYMVYGMYGMYGMSGIYIYTRYARGSTYCMFRNIYHIKLKEYLE